MEAIVVLSETSRGYSIDLTDGSTSTIKESSNTSQDGWNIRSLAVVDNDTVLFRSDSGPAGGGINKLYSMDLVSGDYTFIGDMGTSDPVGALKAVGMAFASDGNLYGTSFDGDLLLIDWADASTMLVGSSAFAWLSLTGAPEDAVAPSPGPGPVPEPGRSSSWAWA